MNYLKLSIFTKESDFTPPFFIGSMLRGAFGYALKKTVCVNPTFKCDSCFIKSNCLYYEFYEKSNSLHKFRFDIDLAPKNLNFSIYLFYSAVDSLSYTIATLNKMLTEVGLTKSRFKFEIDRVKSEDRTLFDGKNFNLNIEPKELKIDNFCPNIELKLVTPLRVKENNRFLRDDISLETILRSINFRIQKLENIESVKKLKFKLKYDFIEKEIEFLDLNRYSNRQKSRMQLGGVVGNLRIYNLDKESFRLLKFGEVIGVGKQTVFGLGKIEIKEL